MRVEITPTRLLHIREICETMRPRERAAFEKLGQQPERLITHTVASSVEAFSGLIDDRVVAIGGVQTQGIFADKAYMWLIGSGEIERWPITFLRHSVEPINTLASMFPLVYGFADKEFFKSRRWLEWLGFTFEDFGAADLFWRGKRPEGVEIMNTIVSTGF